MAGSPLLDDLRAALGDEAVLTDPDLLRLHRRDEADLCAAGTPLVVVRPRDTAQVVAVVRAAARHGVPVVPQGARTGLAGAANAVDGAVVLSTVAMTAIREIDPVARIAVVQPGVVNATLAGAVRAQGLYYPPDPGSWESSTIGGNVSTNAGGMCCVKYGVTTEYVLGLEVVLASGEVLRTGRRTAKGVAGYDLTRLFVGAEGTLGVITEVTVSLRPGARGVADHGGGLRLDRRGGYGGGRDRRAGAHPEPAGAARPDAPAGDRGVPADGVAHRRPGAAARRRRHRPPGGGRPGADRRGLHGGRRRARYMRPPTRWRRRRCSRPAGWPTRRWRSSPPTPIRTATAA